MAFQLSEILGRDKVFLVKRSKLEEVWNSEFYKPEFFENRERLKRNKFGLVRLQAITSTITKGETPLWRGDGYKKNGIRFIKSENVLENELDVEHTDFIEKEVHLRMKRSQLKAGDVLFNIVGASIGRACVYCKNEKANINQAVCLIRLNDQFNPYWLASLLGTSPYKTWINQLKSGGARDNIDLGQVRDFQIPNHPTVIQDAIISIIQKATELKKQKEARAQQLLNSIDTYLLNKLGIELPVEEENSITLRMYVRKFSEVSGGRFDAAAFQPHVENTKKAIRNGVFKTDKLKHVVTFNAEQVVQIGSRTYIGLENIQSNTGEYLPSEEKTSMSSAGTFKKGDILFPKLRPYLNKVFHASFDGVCSTEFHVLQASKIDPAFFSFFLRSKAVVNQTTYLMTGNTLPRLQTFDIQNLDIPLPPLEKQNEIAVHIQTIRDQAKQLRAEAVAGLERAKQEVEAMIFGEIEFPTVEAAQ